MADVKPPESPAEAAALLAGQAPVPTPQPSAQVERKGKGKKAAKPKRKPAEPLLDGRIGQPCKRTAGCEGILQEFSRFANAQERKITLICSVCRAVQAVQTTVLRQR